MTDYRNYILTKKEKRNAGILIALALAAVSILFFKSPVLILLLPFVLKRGWEFYADYCKRKRQKTLLREFRDFLFSLSTAFATGRHMTEAMKEAKIALDHIYGRQGLMSREICQMLKAIEETGESDLKVFTAFADRTGLEDIQLLAEVYGACRETGGDMAAAVHKAAALLTEKINIEMEIQTMLLQKKLEGTIITVMPAAMIVLLLWISPDYLEPMYSSVAGRLMMTLALILNVFAYFWMEKMTHVTL